MNIGGNPPLQGTGGTGGSHPRSRTGMTEQGADGVPDKLGSSGKEKAGGAIRLGHDRSERRVAPYSRLGGRQPAPVAGPLTLSSNELTILQGTQTDSSGNLLLGRRNYVLIVPCSPDGDHGKGEMKVRITKIIRTRRFYVEIDEDGKKISDERELSSTQLTAGICRVRKLLGSV